MTQPHHRLIGFNLGRAVATLGLGLSLLCATLAHAQEAAIRKNLAERLPNLPKIDEVSKTPMAGLYEVRVNGVDILYTDAEGNYLIQGMLIDTKAPSRITGASVPHRKHTQDQNVTQYSSSQFSVTHQTGTQPCAATRSTLLCSLFSALR